MKIKNKGNRKNKNNIEGKIQLSKIIWTSNHENFPIITTISVKNLTLSQQATIPFKGVVRLLTRISSGF